MTQITVQEAETRLAQLVRAAQQGEEIVLLENSQPVAKIVPVLAAASTQKPHRRFGSGKGLFRISPDFDAPLEDFREYTE